MVTVDLVTDMTVNLVIDVAVMMVATSVNFLGYGCFCVFGMWSQQRIVQFFVVSNLEVGHGL